MYDNDQELLGMMDRLDLGLDLGFDIDELDYSPGRRNPLVYVNRIPLDDIEVDGPYDPVVVMFPDEDTKDFSFYETTSAMVTVDAGGEFATLCLGRELDEATYSVAASDDRYVEQKIKAGVLAEKMKFAFA